ncbi:MAG: protein-disulfide reductase DsbD N-terminal domain-containing protein [Aquamicrobium sp.]|uniref:protein-disulfide reductase DsbD N-terminal domain-containing protein n=1 Tax=Aquamicrobium sp. TaxID=1872579 RepID=UPI00349E9D39|nr:protein-disulfide reductase DsbD N-terminal domain-containing protein [Aquamicrobium sp.]
MDRRAFLMFPAALLFAAAARAQPARLLPAEEAFRLSVRREAGGVLVFRWDIAQGHYLYRERFEARDAGTGAPLALDTGPGFMEEADANFGPSEVYYGEAVARLTPGEAARVNLVSQGCRKNEICYPPVSVTVDTRSLAIDEAGGGLDLDAAPEPR